MRGNRAFVGRALELDVLSGAVAVGDPTLVTGEPGIGKTRLLEELCVRLAGLGRLPIIVRCLPLSNQLPMLPLTELLRCLHARDGGLLVKSVLEDCSDYVGEELVRLLPDLGATSRGPSEGWERERMFAALAAFWEAAAAGQGLVAVIEDLHWSDSATLDFLTYLLSRSERLGLVLTARPVQPGHGVSVSSWIADTGSRLRRLVVPKFTEEETASLARTLTGAVPSAATSGRLWSRTDGNPFFAEQLVAAGLEGAERGMPDELAELLRARVFATGPEQRRIVELLAVAGRPLVEDELAEITGYGVMQVRHDVRALTVAQLVRPDSSGGYTTRHMLVAEAVVDGLLPAERQQLHAEIAGVLAQRDEADLAAEIADHWQIANWSREELPARIAAAEHAELVLGFLDAARHWTRSFELAERAGAEEAAGLALRGMTAWQLTGVEEAGVEVGEHGVQLAAAAGLTAVHAALSARLAGLYAARDRRRGLAEMQAAVTEFADLPISVEKVSALHRLAVLFATVGRRAEGLPYLRQAIELSRNEPSAASVYVRCLGTWAFEELHAGAVDEGLAALREARRMVETRSVDVQAQCWLAVAEVNSAIQLNRIDDAVQRGSAALALAQAHGLGESFVATLLAANLVDAHLARGRVTAAADLVDGMLDGRPVRLHTQVLHSLKCRIDVPLGDLTDAGQRLEQVMGSGSDAGVEISAHFCRIRAEVALWSGDPISAMAIVPPTLTGVIAADEEPFPDLYVLGMRACADAAETAMARRDRDGLVAARSRADELRTIAGRGQPFAPHPYYATATAEGAEWAAESNRCEGLDRAELWATAADAWETLRFPHRAAYDRWRETQAHLAAGHRDLARLAFRAAWYHAAEHVPLKRELERLARIARLDLPDDKPPLTAAPSGKTDPYGLTQRERDVLSLLGQGMTNTQIGARLYMSPKTASVHVSAILAKLQATNRVHAVAIAQRAGLIQ